MGITSSGDYSLAHQHGAPASNIEVLLDRFLSARDEGDGSSIPMAEGNSLELEGPVGARLKALRCLDAYAVRVVRSGAPIAFPDIIDAELNDALADDSRELARLLPAYEFIRRISLGGQGAVHEAVHCPTGRHVAIKLLIDGPLATTRHRRRFEREGEFLAALNHPNIVALYDSSTVRGRNYLVMQYVEGRHVDDYCLLHDLGSRAIVSLFGQVCDAVRHAHQNQVIHRDLKPSNILVDDAGVVHVCDFGLAKDTQNGKSLDDSLISLAGTIVGTLPYLSPEQIEGTAGGVDTRTDVYALGIVLFQLLTGNFPYPVDEDPAAAQFNIVNRKPATLHEAAGRRRVEAASWAVNAELEAIVAKALSKEKDRRYQSVDALAADLDRYLHGHAVEARADSAWYLARKTVRRYRIPLAVAAAFVLLLGASAITATRLYFQARAERDRAQSFAGIAQSTLSRLVTEIDAEIRPLVGGTQVRDRILGPVAGDLGRLESLVRNAPGFEEITETLHEKRGDIAAASGHRVEALREYAELVRSIERLTPEARNTRERRLLVARAKRKLAELGELPAENLASASTLCGELRAAYPTDASVAEEACLCALDYSMHYRDRFDARAALEQTQLAKSIVRERYPDGRPIDARWSDILGLSLENECRALRVSGDNAGALRSAEESVQARRELAALRPADSQARYAFTEALRILAGQYSGERRFAEAVRVLEEAAKVGDYLVTADPRDPRWKRCLCAISEQLTSAHLDNGQVQAARLHASRAVALSAELMAADPNDHQTREAHAHSLHRLGATQIENAQYEVAAVTLGQSAQIYESVLMAAPQDRRIAAAVANTLSFQGAALQRCKKMREGLMVHQKALRIRESLLVADPDSVVLAEHVIASLKNTASAHMKLREPEHDAIAGVLYTRAERMLTGLRSSDRLTGRDAEYELWLREMAKSQKALEIRAAKREASKTFEELPD